MKRKASSVQQNKIVKRQRRDAMYMALPKGRPGYGSVARTRGAAVQGEMKYFDSELAGAVINASATWTACYADPTAQPVANINCLFCPTQGAGIAQRIGKAAKLCKIRIYGQVTRGTADAGAVGVSGGSVRLILYQDMQTNAAQVNTNVLMRSSAAANNTVAVHTPQNTDGFGRFRVLKDKLYTLDDPNMTTGNDSNEIVKHFKWTVKFKTPIEVHFNATNGGTIADIIDHSFHLAANTDIPASVATISYHCRCCFKE